MQGRAGAENPEKRLYDELMDEPTHGLKRLVSATKNKAENTIIPIACGWAGAVFELPENLGTSSEAKDRKNIKKK